MADSEAAATISRLCMILTKTLFGMKRFSVAIKRLPTKGTKTMSKRPSHLAYVVIEPKEGSEKKAHWMQVGSIWPHKNGSGFDLVIPAGISVAGRIVCTPTKQPDEAPGSAEDLSDGPARATGPVRRSSPKRQHSNN
jgi:hypothetical protein